MKIYGGGAGASSLLLDLSAQDKNCSLVNPTGKSNAPTALATLNALAGMDFITLAGPVFEHSPWVAEAVVEQRPFPNLEALHSAMCGAVREASAEQQLALIRAHPDLVGRAVLTAESQGEQAASGLLDLRPDEVALFNRYNREYQARFGFPFVICARLNKKDSILAAFPQRLKNGPDTERATALEEIFKIARLRLNDLIRE